MNNRFFYAQLDASGVVVGKSDLSGLVDSPLMIKVESLNGFSLGDSYIDGAFVPNVEDKSEEGA